MPDPIPAPIGPLPPPDLPGAVEGRCREVVPPVIVEPDGASLFLDGPPPTVVPSPARLVSLLPDATMVDGPAPGLRFQDPVTSATKPLLPPPLAAAGPAVGMTDLADARQTAQWQAVTLAKSAADPGRIQGPAIVGSVLAGAAMATGVGIDLSRGTLLTPPDLSKPGVKLSGSPSLDGGSISLSGRF